MKRIIEDSTEYETLKPLFGSYAQAPFYDPNDLHVHNWFYGKLGIEEDPKIPTFSNNKMSVKNCVYCKVCHKIKLDFQSIVSSNKDIVSDLLYDVFEYKFTEDFIATTSDKIELKISIAPEKPEEKLVGNSVASENLFIKTNGIYDNYVKVSDI